jgi:acyl-CoA synthetase (AMP-forming)/AMP-acid ligase II
MSSDREAYVAKGLWSATETLPTRLARHAMNRPGVLAAVDNLGGSVTYSELAQSSVRMADALRARGIGPADVVGVQMPNRVEAVIASAAVEKLGAVVCPLVPPYREKELDYIVGKTRMKALFVPGVYRGFDHGELAKLLSDRHDHLATVVTLGDNLGSSFIGFDSLRDEGSWADDLADPQLDPDAPCAILFTSGTESTPKGAVHTHNTLLANVRAILLMLEMDEDAGVFMASPVGHGTGYGFGIRLAGYLGSTLSLLDRWEPRIAAEMLQEHGAVYTHGALPFVNDLVNLPGIESFDLSRLRYFVTGGAAVPPSTVTLALERLGCRVLRLYGQTEGFMSTLIRPEDPLEKLVNTDGSPVPGVDVRVLDDQGDDVPAGTSGNVVYRGPHRCVEFFEDPERTKASLTADGWFRSGDLASIDADGYLTVTGRTKEVINRGGYKYSPREVEEALLTHPAVENVAIVPVRDSRLVERACAFVVLRPGSDLDVDEIGRHLGSLGIAAFKWPERIETVESFPMTASGKIQKFKLAETLNS